LPYVIIRAVIHDCVREDEIDVASELCLGSYSTCFDMLEQRLQIHRPLDDLKIIDSLSLFYRLFKVGRVYTAL
jgi:hypothetical protein